jgi:iron complex outermembrane receptor protein
MQLQAQQGALSGRVQDQLGGAVPEARVFVSGPSNADTPVNAEGEYRFPELAPGTYAVSAQAPGFGVFTGTIDIAGPQTLDIRLGLAGITSTVTVTAQKIEQSEQSVPASITALGAEAVRASRIEEFATLQEYVPNMRFSDYAGRGVYSYLAIRGMGNSGASVEPSATVFIDGVPNTEFFDYGQQLYDLERVEVLRGPQSTLYGSFAGAGVINIFSRQPDNVPRFWLRQEYGNFNSHSTTVNASGPLVRDTLFIGAAANVSGSDGHVRNTVSGKRLNEFVASGRLQVRYIPTARLEFRGSATLQQIDDQGGSIAFPVDVAAYNAAPGVGQYQVGDFEIAVDDQGFRRSDSHMQSLVFRYTGDRYQVVSTTARREGHLRQEADGDRTPAPILTSKSTGKNGEYYQEVRIQSLGARSNAFSYVAGFSYNHSWQPYQNVYVDRAGAFGGPINAEYLVYDTGLDSDSYGVYGQATRRVLSSRLGLTAGVRIDHARRAVNQKGPSFLGPGFVLARESSRVLPKVAVDYQLTDGVLLYGSLASGWKPAGVNPYAGAAADALFDAEHNWAYEGGLKSSYLNQRVTINLAGFYNDIAHYQVSVVDGTTFGYVFQIGNADDANIKGVEAEVSLRPVSTLEIRGGYGLAQARFGTYILNPFTGFHQHGQRIDQLPDSTGNVVVQYRLPGQFFVRGELIAATDYKASRYSAPSQSRLETFRQATIPGYAVGHFRAGYESSRWEITGYINNVTNERYFLQATVSPPGGYTGFFGFLGQPRTYGLRGTYRFR